MPHNDLLSFVGNTPLVEIRRLNPYPDVKILAKLEAKNPGGSVKDRVALAMIEAAEAKGELGANKVIIEATSGNTGIGLAMVAAVKGYSMRILMPETASEERKMIMRAYGAEIVLTPGRLGTDGAIEEAYRLAREEPDRYVLMDQFNNPASIEAHYRGTAQEIWDQTGGRVTHAVAALGTTGTAMGLAKRLKELDPKVVVAGVEPNPGHKIQGLKNMLESYPPGIFDRKALDAVLKVEDEEAFELCRRLAREEGLFVGMSSGAALAGALQLAAGLDSGLIVVIFPDGGERYLSTPLFAAKAERGMRLFNLAAGAQTGLEAKGELGLYTVGPSLDDVGELSAWRRLVLLDVLARRLAARGAKVKVAAGLADMDDRTLSAARKAGQTRQEFVRGALVEIGRRAESLGLALGASFPLAFGAAETAVGLCRKLLARGLAYEKLRSVYFDVLRDKRYGDLARVDPDSIGVGRTVDLDAYVKDNPRDFTLLKRATLQDLKIGDVLETEWGNVRPSWFLQVASAGLELGRISLFLAGEAHRFPHLDNLRAIWSVGGQELSAWLVEGGVAAGDGGSVGFEDALAALGGGRALRMWLLSGSYRRPLVASMQSLSMWARNWRKVQECAAALSLRQDAPGADVPRGLEQAAAGLEAGLLLAVEDDLSLYGFWPQLFAFVRLANGLLGREGFSGGAARRGLAALSAVDRLLGILDPVTLPVALGDLPNDVRRHVEERESARKRKDFAASDKLREAIRQAGFRVEDTPAGPRVFRA